MIASRRNTTHGCRCAKHICRQKRHDDTHAPQAAKQVRNIVLVVPIRIIGVDDDVADGRKCIAEIAKIRAGRSEEHTSELQSLMRNSYAVFCLKKKKKTT